MRNYVTKRLVLAVAAACLLGVGVSPSRAQGQTPRPSTGAAANATAAAVVTPPADYTIGPEDQLSVIFYTDKGMSADVIVRPDGKISLPLINDMQAAGLTPEQLRVKVNEEAKRFIQDPAATVVVRQINSRKVFIMGNVEKPNGYPLGGPTTVLQLIATAGGLKEYAKSEAILINRTEAGRQTTLKFNYKEFLAQKNMSQNVELHPGDTIVVP